MASIGGHPVEPEGTELKLVVPSGPVSLQSRRKNKAAFSQSLRAALGTPQYLLSGEVSIYAEWLIHERVRYETLQAPDVDNTLKVVLDALCGPDGVLVNDCQVLSMCRVTGSTGRAQGSSLRSRFATLPMIGFERKTSFSWDSPDISVGRSTWICRRRPWGPS